MKQIMERAGNSHLLTILLYPNAGHLIEPPYTPHFRASSFNSVQSTETGRFLFRPGTCRRWLKMNGWKSTYKNQDFSL